MFTAISMLSSILDAGFIIESFKLFYESTGLPKEYIGGFVCLFFVSLAILWGLYNKWRTSHIIVENKQLHSNNEQLNNQIRKFNDSHYSKVTELTKSFEEEKASVIERFEIEKSELIHQLKQHKIKLFQQVKQLENLQDINESLEADVKDLKLEIDELVKPIEAKFKTDGSIWKHPAIGDIPSFVSPQDRHCRIISMINFKGGVGKTTLTANIAAGLATGIIENKCFKVLMVDLDFQGSLSNSYLYPADVSAKRLQQNTSHLLLEDAEVDLSKLLIEIKGTTAGKAIVGSDILENTDTIKQANFIANQHEVRYKYRNVFHNKSITNQFDFIFFDCPPRLTTSSINAILCSDYILIPTNLVPHDVDATSRTLKWISDSYSIKDNHAKLLGIIINRLDKSDSVFNLTVDKKNQFKRLQEALKTNKFLPNSIFNNAIKNLVDISRASSSNEAIATDPTKGHPLYAGLVQEIFNKIQSEFPIHKVIN